MKLHHHASIFVWHSTGQQSEEPNLSRLPEIHNEPIIKFNYIQPSNKNFRLK